MAPSMASGSLGSGELNTDFASLAVKDPDFEPTFVDTEGILSFKNPHHVLQLTKSILKVNFSLKLDLPPDRLCPPVPVRWAYVKWMQQLVDSTAPNFKDEYDPDRKVVGIDIGVGASCIYPMLACTTRPSWQMHGTDIDPRSLLYANSNVDANNFRDRIHIHDTVKADKIIDLKALGIETATFTMCNPPFFASTEEMSSNTTAKSRPPNSVCTGSANEMITEGGEVAFVTRIYEESKLLGDKVQWYSVMLGKSESTGAMVDKLKADKVENWAFTTFMPGRTKRWGLAWSFCNRRPSVAAQRPKDGRHLDFTLPFPTEMPLSVPSSTSKQKIDAVAKLMSTLDVVWRPDAESDSGICLAKGNVWSRNARRARSRGQALNADVPDDDELQWGLAARVSALPENRYGVGVRLLQGLDVVLFESFCGMVKRELDKALAESKVEEGKGADGEEPPAKKARVAGAE